MLVSKSRNYLFVDIAESGGNIIRPLLSGADWFGSFHLARSICRRLNSLVRKNEPNLPRHAPLIAAQEVLPASTFNEWFKFAFVRNPWDRMVGAYDHLVQRHADLLCRHRVDSFKSFIEWIVFEAVDYEDELSWLIHAIRRHQRDYIVGFDGQQLADFVGRFENLPNDFRAIAKRVGLDPELAKRLTDQYTSDYRKKYIGDAAEIVAKHFAKDVQTFDYTFDEPGQIRCRTVLRPRTQRVFRRPSMALS